MGEAKVPVAIIGSGNIGTDLLIKLQRSPALELALRWSAIDPASDGLARARRCGVATTAEGVDWLLRACGDCVDLVFDATSPTRTPRNAPRYAERRASWRST